MCCSLDRPDGSPYPTPRRPNDDDRFLLKIQEPQALRCSGFFFAPRNLSCVRQQTLPIAQYIFLAVCTMVPRGKTLRSRPNSAYSRLWTTSNASLRALTEGGGIVGGHWHTRSSFGSSSPAFAGWMDGHPDGKQLDPPTAAVLDLYPNDHKLGFNAVLVMAALSSSTQDISPLT